MASASRNPFPTLTAEEAAALINNGDIIGFGGFTQVGVPKAIPAALAKKAEKLHADGQPFKVGVYTVGTGPSLDGALAKAKAIGARSPYQSDGDSRAGINSGEIQFFDMHLSHITQAVRYGFLGKMKWAILEAADVTPDGGILLTSAVGAANTWGRCADRVLIEINKRQPTSLLGLHDIYEPLDPPNRREIPVYTAKDRIGTPLMYVDPAKIAGIVYTDLNDEVGAFDEPTPETTQIGNNVAEFLSNEMKAGRIPKSFLPLQSGVGNIANALLGALGASPDIPQFSMYTEVLQNSVVDMIRKEQIGFVSTTSLTLSQDVLKGIYDNLDWFRSRLILRPQEISNHPEVIRRIGIIAINTALEVDVFGNVNSTHVMGQKMMNGIGGSGDFARNAYLSIFTCTSTAKGGKISTIVPLVSHMDHSEHSVQAIATEFGVADLRGLDPHQRAERIISVCAHPDFREELRDYVKLGKKVHEPQTLSAAFGFHDRFLSTGTMHGAGWSKAAATKA